MFIEAPIVSRRDLRHYVPIQGLIQQRHPTMAELKLKDKTVLRSLGLGGFFGGGAEGMVDVKDGRIVRIRPMRYGWKYNKEEVRQWRMSKNGKSIEPTWKSLPGPFSLAYKKRVYSANRIAYPLKRVDWDPEGERNTQNRGRSKYVRVSWDEASSTHSQMRLNGSIRPMEYTQF